MEILENIAVHMEKISMHVPETKKKRVIVIGGGFAGIEFTKQLDDRYFQVVMFDRHNYHTFQPLLYQVATAGLEPDSIAGPLRKLVNSHKDFYFRLARVEKINPEKNTISTKIGELKYDYLVIANGAKTNYYGNEAIYTNAFPLKQLPQALDLRSHMLQNFERAILTDDPEELQAMMNFVIVGGGPTGVEVAGAISELKKHVLPKDYPELDFSQMKIYLVEGLPRLLNGMSDKSGIKAEKYLKDFGVIVLKETIVKTYDGKMVIFNDGTQIPSHTLIWGAGVTGNLIDGLKEDSVFRERILVNEYNIVKGYDNIFAIGDIALMVTEEHPKGFPMLAPVAMQQGKHLADNLKKLAKMQRLKPFNYLDKGSMATVGRNKAVVDLPGKLHFGGLFAWLIWMFIHLISIIGFRNKLVVFNNWIWNYFTYDRSTRLIIRPFIKAKIIKREYKQ